MNFLKDPRTNWKYILVVVILASIVGGGILGYQYWWLPKQEVKAPKIKVPEEKIVEDKTADWKIYSGNGFTIKYPQDWKVAREESINLTYLTPEKKRVPEDIWVYATVSKRGGLLAQPFFDFFGKPEPSPEKVKINEKELYKSEEKFEGIRNIRYAIPNKDESKIGWITLSIRYGRQRMDYYLPDNEIVPELKIFNLMLSTFKFIEVDETADWKIYRNEEYGFELKYYKDWTYKEAGPYTYFFPEIYGGIGLAAIQLQVFIWNEDLNQPREGRGVNIEEHLCKKECPPEIIYSIKKNSEIVIARLTIQKEVCGHMACVEQRSVYPLSDYQIENIVHQMLSNFRFLE